MICPRCQELFPNILVDGCSSTGLILRLPSARFLKLAAILVGGEGQNGAGRIYVHDGEFSHDHAGFAGQDTPGGQQDVLRVRLVECVPFLPVYIHMYSCCS